MKVGFIGLGAMGAGMAANLGKAGHELTVYNRSADRARPLVTLGAKQATQVAGATKGSDVVFTMLSDDAALEQVTFGEAGILATLAPNAIHVSASTISVALSQRLTRAHAEANQKFVSAPVFGRPDMAAAGKLFVVAAGEAAAVERVSPLLQSIGQRTFVIGTSPDAANVVKLSGNFLIACVIETLGEAMALVGKAGIDQKKFLEVLTSTLFSAPAYHVYGPLIVEQNFEPASFPVQLGAKDLRLAMAAAESLSVPMPVANLLRDRFLRLTAAGKENLDWSAISMLAAQDAGIANRR